MALLVSNARYHTPYSSPRPKLPFSRQYFQGIYVKADRGI
jgi:hypothetical protein